MTAIWRQLWPLVRPQASRLCAAYLCMTIYALATASLAFLCGPTLAFMFRGRLPAALGGATGAPSGLWRHLPAAMWETLAALPPARAGLVVPALLVAAAAAKGLAQLGQLTLMGQVSQATLLRLRRDAFAAVLVKPPAFFARRPHGDVLSRLTTDAHQVERALFDGLGPLLRDTLSVAALLVFCALSDNHLAGWLCLGVPLAAWPLALFTRWIKGAAAEVQAAAGRLHAVMDEAIAGVRVVQAFGGEAHEAARVGRAARDYRHACRRAHLVRALRSPTLEGLAVTMLAVLIALMAREVRERGADPAHYISFFAAIVMMYDPLKKLGYVGEYLAQGAAALERIAALSAEPPAVASPPHAPPAPPLSAGLTFQRVDFAYDGGRAVLAGFDLHVAAGEKLALVGASGAGKTTLAALVMRFWDVTGGRLLWDGVDLRRLDLASLRRQIAWVGQDTFLFDGTVADNVAYGMAAARPEAIEAACRAALAHPFIARLPRGYQTPLGERGVALSGGQRQRLAIARALLRDAPLVVFDEATSHLDVLSEQAVHRAMAPLLRGRTALIIAHRLSTLAHADSIAVVEAGQVIERGPHAALLATGGAYARLHAADAAGAGGREGPPRRVGAPA